MKLRVSLRPTEDLGNEKGEVATACVDCGNGEQILRWLAFAACDRAAHLANLPSGTFVPQAVINREGVVEDVDAVIRALYADGDGVVVRFSRGPEAFTVRWEGRPSTPPRRAETSVPEPTSERVKSRGSAWLESKLDFELFGIPALVSETLASSRKDARSEEIVAARETLLSHAGALQALFKLYESDGDVDARDVDKMTMEQFRRFMVDAKAMEIGPQTITASDVDACFNEALKKKGDREKEQKGVAKTLDAVGFLIAVLRVGCKKYDSAVMKSPDIGFAELHRRLEYFVEQHIHKHLSGAFEKTHVSLRRASNDADAVSEIKKAERLVKHAMKMCMPRRPPGVEWTVFVHDLTKNLMEWGMLGDDADVSPGAMTLGKPKKLGSSLKTEDDDASAKDDVLREGEDPSLRVGDIDTDPFAPVSVDLHAYARAVIDAKQNVGDVRAFTPEESPARLDAAQFEKLLLSLAWLQHGKRVSRAKFAREAAETARLAAEARRRRRETKDDEEEHANDASSNDSENDAADAGKNVGVADANANANASEVSKEADETDSKIADSTFAVPPFAEHLRDFLVDIFYKAGVLMEMSDGERDEPESDGDEWFVD
jgi:palmitoyltransferase ZDHHC9/14/18